VLLIPWIGRNVHAHLMKKSATLNWRTSLNVTSLAAFAAREFNEIFGQTAASGCKSSPTFQGLTASPSSGCCWRLDKTKTDQQLPYCAVCTPSFGLCARREGHLFVSFGFTGSWTCRRSQSLKRWTTFTYFRGCLPEILLLMLYTVSDHTYLQRVNRLPL